MTRLSWLKRLAALAGLSALTFYVFVYVGAWMPLWISVGASGPAVYLSVTSLSTALIVGTFFGLICGKLFSDRPLPWALACSGVVATVYLAYAVEARATQISPMWWPVLLDVGLFMGVFVIAALLKGRGANAQVI